MNFKNLLNNSYFGNSVLDYTIVLGVIVGGMILLWIMKTLIIHHLRKLVAKTKTTVDDNILALVERFLVPLLYVGLIYFSIISLELNASLKKAMDVFAVAIVTLVGIRLVLAFIRLFIFDVYVPKQKTRSDLEPKFRSLMPAFSVIVWGAGIVFLIDNLGFNISAVVTGLGIGGVAVALAASAVLGDLFAYISIMFDKPFVLGDFLIVGDYLGSVEHIGIKTTRIRSLGGEQLIFSNKDLTDSRIRNYKRMKQRRVVFKLGVTYDTSLARMKEIPEVIKKVIEATPNTKFDRAHFSSYGDFNLEIEVVYYVLSGDYNLYMDVQQMINFAIKEEFEKRKIEFAFPTQTLHLVKQN